jgi:hypothetical protein
MAGQACNRKQHRVPLQIGSTRDAANQVGHFPAPSPFYPDDSGESFQVGFDASQFGSGDRDTCFYKGEKVVAKGGLGVG